MSGAEEGAKHEWKSPNENRGLGIKTTDESLKMLMMTILIPRTKLGTGLLLKSVYKSINYMVNTIYRNANKSFLLLHF